MAQIVLTFIDPEGSQLEADVDDDMTPAQIIQGLIDEHFIPRAEQGIIYALNIKGKARVNEGQTLAQAGAKTGDTVSVVRTPIGGAYEQ